MIRDESGKLDLKAIQAAYRESREQTDAWRHEAWELLEYASGHQWAEDDVAIMEEQERPYVTFNKMEPLVNALCGLEVLNRQEVRYLPRRPGPTNTQVADLKTGAAHYLCEEGDSEAEVSTAFRNLGICGMGWVETRMDYDSDPDGEVEFTSINPLWQYWDARARKRNLADAEWILRLKPFGRKAFEERWPDADVSYSNIWEPPQDYGDPHDATEAWRYESEIQRELPRRNIWVGHLQWFEPETRYRVQGLNGQVMEFDSKMWRRIKRRAENIGAPALRAVPIKRRQYYHAYICGDTLLEETKHECKSFTQQCMTGKPDANRGVWYGLARNLRDPQDWLNVLYSAILHILRSGSKGGLLAETDAFENPRKAEQDWARADAITWLKTGALAKQKVQERGQVQYPSGMHQLMDVANTMFQGTTGMNLELLGLAERVQPGVLEAQRKQAGMTILSWAFDALRLFRKRHGRLLAEFIENYLSDGRLIRVSGPEGQQYVPLLKDPEVQEFDIIVAAAPSSTSEKEKTWAVLEQLLPYLIQTGLPIPPEVWDYVPLPAPLAEAWKKSMQPNPQAQQEQQKAKQMAEAAQQAEIGERQSRAVLNVVKAKSEAEDVQIDRYKALTDRMEALEKANVAGIKEAREWLQAGEESVEREREHMNNER